MDYDPSVLDAVSWRYLQEGNENMVFSYVGPSSHHRCHVLRVSKCRVGIALEKGGARNEPACRRMFDEAVVSRLIGPEYLQDKAVIPVAPAFLHKLNRAALRERPSARLHKHIDVDSEYVTLARNLLYMVGSDATFSVEIKPKWGFLPTSPYLHGESIKRRTCRFCMHQVLKCADNLQARSMYCPLLLYSADVNEKFVAVQQLFETPRNNLRCFIDGREVGPTFALDAVAKRFAPYDRSLLQKLISSVLSRDGILSLLQRLQQDFDVYDIEGVQQVLGTMDPSTVREATKEEWYQLVDDYLKGRRLDPTRSLTSLTLREKLEVIHSYLISATFKDCSLMISFASNGSGLESNRLQAVTLAPQLMAANDPLTRLNFGYQIGVVDLDPKPITKLPSYIQLDQSITAAFLTHFSPQCCAASWSNAGHMG
ncbi:hypothetical protein L0F63_001770 [Massospora cicadina]|nr:hypothetical protein L0F63_001770 [Massospora cicadina]